jgi:hypothetical protein
LLRFGDYPLYSVDASALIAFKAFRRDIFGKMWRLAGDLADRGRLLICEEAAAECKDDELLDFMREHPVMVVAFDHIDHLKQLQAEAPRHSIELVRPDATRDEADPFVVALALMLDQRDPHDLQRKLDEAAACLVVTEEKPKGPGARWAKIPNACDFYALACIDWQELLRREGYSDSG